jgi:hypothetical protein
MMIKKWKVAGSREGKKQRIKQKDFNRSKPTVKQNNRKQR